MTTPAGHRAAADLRALREQWGDLLAAISRRPAPEWPPRRTQERAVEEAALDRDTTTRLPLTLREHPAPVNLDALDAAVAIEEALFESCDAITELVQRPVVPGGYRVDQADRDDPRRWHLPTVRDAITARPARILTATDPRTDQDHARRAARLAHIAEHTGEQQAQPRPRVQTAHDFTATTVGSRAHGLHWAAVWLEDRALQTVPTDLHGVLPTLVVEDLATVARRALHRLEAALGRDGRATVLDDPCPYCGGHLTARTRTGDPTQAVIACTRGEACEAPVPLSFRRRREWSGADLATLWAAMDARRRAAA